ncbi:MAG TPA: DNA-3-methyladenine glycosylase 2 family protein [Candidatus Dojkabacteria bacterium]|nr:DNA-3-methyladenine glycosylase 2 family protein [Candidatus Dojkabacteria bacterium]
MKKVLEHFKNADPIIYQILINNSFEVKAKPKSEYYSSLTRSIVYQQLNGKAAQTIYQRFTKAVDKENFTPKDILNTEIAVLRASGLSESKANYVKNIAQATTDGIVNFDILNDLSNEEVIRVLTQIKGVGRWTAEMFLMFTLGREDIFSNGDYGLKKGIEKLYGPNYDLDNLEARWKPYRTYVSLALWHSLDNS